MRRWNCAAASVLLLAGAAGARAASPPPAPAATLVADATSGLVLRAQGADQPLPMGTLGHLMLALLAMEHLAAGASDEVVTVSAAVAAAGGAVLDLREGDRVAVVEVLRALVVGDAPDAAQLVAEVVAADEAGAIVLMNERARALGMIATEYGSLHGTNTRAAKAPSDVTTARDTAKLVAELLQHPPIVEWARLTGIPFREGAVLLRNANQLLGAVPGVDGLRVGRAGPREFHMVATARRGALRLIAITLGAPDSASRYDATVTELDWGFATYDRIDIMRAGDPVQLPVRIDNGVDRQIVPVAGANCSVLRRRTAEPRLELSFQLPAALAAPVARHERVGEIIVREDGQLLAVVPAVSPADVPAADWVLSAAQLGR